jgi:hypothetical protein
VLQPLFGLSRDFEEEFRLCFAVAGPLGRPVGTTRLFQSLTIPCRSSRTSLRRNLTVSTIVQKLEPFRGPAKSFCLAAVSQNKKRSML